MNPPLCKCHGSPMEWNKDKRPRFADGGYWRCKVKHAASRARYDKSEKGRAKNRRYAASPGGAAIRQLHEIARFRVRY